MSLSYTYEKLYTAARGLATGANSIQSRLHNAYLGFHTLQANDEDFPTQELRDQFTSILAALTCVPAQGDEGSVQAAVRTMTDDEATQVAEEIFDLFIAIARLEHAEQS